MGRMPSPLIDSLLQAIAARPHDVPLRLHVAELLIGAGRGPEAVQQCAFVLQQEPANTRAQELMGRAFAAPPAEERPTPPTFDWRRAEQQFGDGPAPMFVRDAADAGDWADDEVVEVAAPEGGGIPARDIWEVEAAGMTLADVGGMHHVKERLEVSFLAPMRNPELRKLYGKSLRGGLLLYGHPAAARPTSHAGSLARWARASST